MFTDILTPRQEYPDLPRLDAERDTMDRLHLLHHGSDTMNCWLSTFGKPEDEACSVSILVRDAFTVIPE